MITKSEQWERRWRPIRKGSGQAFFNRPAKGQGEHWAGVALAVGRERAVLELDPELGCWEDLVDEGLHEVEELTAGTGVGEVGVPDPESEGTVEMVGMGHVGDVELRQKQNWVQNDP